MTVNLFRYTDAQAAATKKPRRRREKLSEPKQKRLNDRRAKQYFEALIDTNFGSEDVHLVLTYKVQPEGIEAAEHEVENYLRRVAYRRKKLGLPPLKRIVVTEGGDISKRTGKRTRIHHHVIMNGGIDRDELELMWNTKPVRWQWLAQEKTMKDGRKYKDHLMQSMLGFCNTRRLQPDETGLTALSKYLSKDPKGKKRWSASQNLRKPERVTRDHHYSCRNYQKCCAQGEIFTKEFWEKKYKGYTLAGSPDIAVEAEAPDDMNDWRVFAKLRKIE